MANLISTRVAALEKRLSPSQARVGRVFRVVAGNDSSEAVDVMLADRGFDPDAGDFAIVRIIVSAPGQPKYERAPQIVDLPMASFRAYCTPEVDMLP